MRLHIQLFHFFHFVSLLALAVALWFSAQACVFRPLSKNSHHEFVSACATGGEKAIFLSFFFA